MRINIYKRYRNVLTSLWLIPVLCVLVGIGISFSTLAIDRAGDYRLVPEDLVGGPEAALEVLTTVAASMVNLTVLVLTIVLVVVQLAMGQFSPRIVQRLLRDRPSQLVIGLFVATFVHTLLTIREIQIEPPRQVPGVAIVTTYAQLPAGRPTTPRRAPGSPHRHLRRAPPAGGGTDRAAPRGRRPLLSRRTRHPNRIGNRQQRDRRIRTTEAGS